MDNNPITLNLELHEVNGILAALGQLPTASNAWPLLVKIKTQTETQLPKEST